jgi:hypothetical protein
MVNIMVQWLVTGIVAVMHPFYVSVIEINHNPKEASVEISVRAFAEDMEKILQKYNTAKIDILNPTDKAFLEGQISTYILQKIKINVNGQPITMKYIGHEIQKESVWCFFEVPKVTDVSKLELDCNLLYDFEKNQTNIVHVKSKGTNKSFKLDFPARTAVFNF